MSHDEPGDATPWVPSNASLAKLEKAAQKCEGCDLFRTATQAVMGRGPTSAALMLIGEQPGDKEDLAGKPFVGPAGKLLDKALLAADIEPESVFLTNAVKHFRFSGTRGKQRIHKSPSRWHVAACEPWLIAELDLVEPQGVVLLGATAGAAIYGSQFRLGDYRGSLHPWPEETSPQETSPQETSRAYRPDWVLPTTHPSAVLRSRNRAEDFEQLVADLRVAADRLTT